MPWPLIVLFILCLWLGLPILKVLKDPVIRGQFFTHPREHCQKHQPFPRKLFPVKPSFVEHSNITRPPHCFLQPCQPAPYSELLPNTIQSYRPQTVLQKHLLSQEFRQSSRTEAFSVLVAPGTQLIFIKHFLAPGVSISTFPTITCLIFKTIWAKAFYYTLLTWENRDKDESLQKFPQLSQVKAGLGLCSYGCTLKPKLSHWTFLKCLRYSHISYQEVHHWKSWRVGS